MEIGKAKKKHETEREVKWDTEWKRVGDLPQRQILIGVWRTFEYTLRETAVCKGSFVLSK